MVSLRIYRDEAQAQGLQDEDIVRIQHPGPAGRGSTGNVLAALASFFVPGLGQLVQGRLFSVLLHAASVIDAALWKEA